MTRKSLIRKYKDLFWYFDKKKLENMSDEVLVEFILNYGSWQAFHDLLKVLGIAKVAKAFNAHSLKKRKNLMPEIFNYFKLFFKSHAPEHIK